MDEASALVDMIGLLIKLQCWFIFGVIDVDDGTCVSTEQRIHRHAQLHVEALNSLKDLVIINDDGTNFGVLTLIELNL